MYCPVCVKEIQEQFEYCPNCGHKIKSDEKCANCGNPVVFSQAYCVNCGKPVQSEKQKKAAKDKWRLFPVSIILYLTLLVVHLIFYLIFKKSAIKNLPYISLFDSILIIIWASFPVYNIKQALKFEFKLKFKHIAFFIAGVLIGFLFALGIVKLIQYFTDVKDVSMVDKLRNAGHSFFMIILIICIQPAIIEELAFRGIIYNTLRASLAARETIIISAFLFAMLHLSFVSLPHLMLLGLFFGYLRYKTGSIWPSVIAHFLHNLGAVLIDKYHLF